jgi:hypothetical protein
MKSALAMMVLDLAGLFPCEQHAELFWSSVGCFPSEALSGAAATK